MTVFLSMTGTGLSLVNRATLALIFSWVCTTALITSAAEKAECDLQRFIDQHLTFPGAFPNPDSVLPGIRTFLTKQGTGVLQAQLQLPCRPGHFLP
jgi:hypothetical protein